MSEFTKGPWRVKYDGNYPIIRKDFSPTHHMNICGPIHGYMYSENERKNQEANAHLIAAAPDMYEALENLLIAIGMGWDTEGCEDAAKAALAKARGE